MDRSPIYQHSYRIIAALGLVAALTPAAHTVAPAQLLAGYTTHMLSWLLTLKP